MSDSLSTTDVARLLSVAVRSVAKWIDQGQLKAGRTPGGHRRIEVGDLVEFLQRHGLPIPPELSPPSAPRVLIVDDDEAVARWLAEEVQSARHDWEVGQAHDGFTAGELVAAWRPDAVILDLRMPGVDGFEVCRRIKTRAETQTTAVIAVTAYLTAEAKRRILACGARACLGKPLDRDLLLRELEAAVNGIRRRSTESVWSPRSGAEQAHGKSRIGNPTPAQRGCPAATGGRPCACLAPSQGAKPGGEPSE